MLFNSFIFLYLFLPVTYFVFWLLKSKKSRTLWLTVMSYVFYGYWNYRFCLLMLLSTVVSYAAGVAMLRNEDPRRRKICLVVPVTVDLVLLCVFKYANFLSGSLNGVLNFLQMPAQLPVLRIILPIGISFYTFHTISYMVDSYRGTITPTKNFLEFACYVSLFSQLVAGPIVRFRQIEGDLEHIGVSGRGLLLNTGWSFFVIGLVKKVLLADSIARIIDPALKNYGTLSSLSAWICMLGYAYQLYFDFSGYSDMAVGLGCLFGLRLPQNFDSPYKAAGIADFWRRWHMSLSTCLRDYLYIPLGGNRGGRWFVWRNLMITMLLGGLWHGANWTFVLWGLYHGILLIADREARPGLERVPLLLRQFFTFILVVIGWVLFRSDDFHMARILLSKMFAFSGGSVLVGFPAALVLLALAAGVAHGGRNTFELRHEWRPLATWGWAFLFVLCLFTMYGTRQSPFLYFQF